MNEMLKEIMERIGRIGETLDKGRCDEADLMLKFLYLDIQNVINGGAWVPEKIVKIRRGYIER